MKKQIIFIVCLITFFGVSLFSQESPQVRVEGKAFDYQKYQEAFSELDANKIATGFLADKAIQLLPFELYNGSDTAPKVTQDAWRMLYSQIYRSQINNRFLSTQEVYKHFKESAQNNDPFAKGETLIPIFVIDVNYNEIRRDAFDQNLLKAEDSKIKDVSTKAEENPYLTKKLFVATALKDKIYKDKEVIFILDHAFYFTNEETANNIYEIDFGDGLGFREVKFGDKIHVSYAQEGNKTLQLRKTEKDAPRKSGMMRAPSAGGSFITSFSVSTRASTAPTATFTIPLSFAIPSNYPLGGVQVSGTAYVLTADGTSNIRNPFIICEGFDPQNTMGYYELYGMLDSNNFASCLRENGYDLIILNFNDGGTYIERNAYLLKGLIEDINARKVTDNELVVVGASMGGLVSRYALAYMEQNNIDHETRLFISFDSPQRGANIPLGIQRWFEFFASRNDDVQDKYNNLLCSTAARQMLVLHAVSDFLRENFVQNLNNVGYPSKLRKIAIANGSGNAYGQRKNDGSVFYPTEQIVDWEHNAFITVIGNAWAVPDNTPETMIFHGAIRPVWYFPLEIRKSYIDETMPYDNAPGGTNNTAEQMALSSTGGKGTISTNVNNHCFIPTVSALDVNTSNLFHNISSDPDILSKTPFDAIYYPIDANEEHVHISKACVSWVLNELVPYDVELGDEYSSWNTGTVKATHSITLKPGFQTIPGKTFEATISPPPTCNP